MTILYYVYAALLLLGGILGYVRARSVPSLAMGAVAALFSIFAAVMMSTHHTRRGLALGILVSLVLGVFFFQRYQETKKPMPALLILVVSVLVLLLSALRWANLLHI